MKRVLFLFSTIAILGAGCSSVPFTASDTNRCDYGGATYENGETFAATDGCNTCSCGDDGMVSCTKIACVETGTLPAITCQTDADCAAQNIDTSLCSQGSWLCVRNSCELTCDVTALY